MRARVVKPTRREISLSESCFQDSVATLGKTTPQPRDTTRQTKQRNEPSHARLGTPGGATAGGRGGRAGARGGAGAREPTADAVTISTDLGQRRSLVDTRTLERTYVDGDTIKMELVLTTARGDTVRITRYLVRSALPAPAPVAAAVAPPG